MATNLILIYSMLNYPWMTTIILLLVACYFYFYKYFCGQIEGYSNSSNIILIGDSILNNSNYVQQNENVSSCLENRGFNVECLAKDNSTLDTLDKQIIQLDKLSRQSTIVVSIGGNDLLAKKNIKDVKFQFEAMIKKLKEMDFEKILIVDIYYPPFIACKPYYKEVALWNNFLSKFNSEKCKIVRISETMNKKDDFVYEIEPSKMGSIKISELIIKNLNL